MKFLFIIQGEGRGHLTQAISLAEMLGRHGHTVTEVLVGKSNSRDVPSFFRERIGAPIRIYDAPSFVFKKNKMHIDKLRTFLFNLSPDKIRKYGKSIETIYKHLKNNVPDAVINFYELLPGLMYLRYKIDIPLISIGHQFMLKHPDYQFGKDDSQNMMILRLHALLTGISASKILALSFYPMKDYLREKLTVMPPLLRKEVLEIQPSNGDYILGYMLNTGYLNEVQKWHEKHPDINLHFFWDKKDADNELVIDKNLTMHQINDKKFLQYMSDCQGYITTAGFESVCEALFLGKMLMLIPAHLEQEINAADAASIHGGVVGNSFDLSVLLDYIQQGSGFDVEGFRRWVLSAEELFIRELEEITQK
ncbi:MAG: hypothetical protein LBE91_00825 [Tannerella sp.]|jgi:uncharacterized protein (TIGR00661 family)|nr:hypothetical protein [Tannerella sp.]